MLGVEADILFTSPVDQARLTSAPFNTTFDYVATARGRVGYTMGTWLPYVTGGLAWSQAHVKLNDLGAVVPPKRSLAHVGWTAGIGLEHAVSGNWTVKAEYDYIDLARRTYDLSDLGLPHVNVDPNIHTFRLGLNYRFGDTPALPGSNPRPFLPNSADWNIHAQTTFLPQAYPAIRSPYEGPNSLPGGGQGRETFTTTAFLGWKLWQGGEFISIRNLRRASVLTAPWGWLVFRTARRKRPARPIREFGRSATAEADVRPRGRTGRLSRTRPIN